MDYTRKTNRQLFLFILFFCLFAFILSRVARFPAVLGAPRDEWSYLQGLGSDMIQDWRDEKHLPVTRLQAVRLIQMIEENGESVEEYAAKLVDAGSIINGGDLSGDLLRCELYSLLERLAELPDSVPGEEYFLGLTANENRVNLLGWLGIIDVPYDRQYLSDEPVTRQDVAAGLARAVNPALRGNNAPVVVQPDGQYTYDRLTGDLHRLAAAYPEWMTLHVIGESVEGRKIYAAELGQGDVNLFIDASIHASEWLTTPLVMKMLEEYVHHASFGYAYGGYDMPILLEDVTFWFIPMLNPDGVTLVLEGPDAVQGGPLARQIRQNFGSAADFSDWKANLHGVDLNRQFSTGWRGMINVRGTPAPSHYKGSTPLSEPEARALYEFTLAKQPSMVISYHQCGEIIYWYYHQQGEQLERDRHIVQALAALTGYRYDSYLVNGGKYRDWVICELGIPAVIMEVGGRVGNTSEWERIWQQNRYVPLVSAELILREKK